MPKLHRLAPPLIAAAVLLVAGAAQAETFIVGAGETYATVEAGLAAASDGDTVLVRAGTYDVAQLRPGSGVTLMSEDGPANTHLFASAGGQAVLIEGVTNVRVEGFDIYSELDLGPRTNALVYVEESTDIYIGDCYLHDAPNDGDILKLNDTQRFVIEDSVLYNPGERTTGDGFQECIDIRGHGDDSITVRGSWLFHEGTHGDYLLYAKGGTTNLLWENNIFGPSAGADPGNVPVETGHLGQTDAGADYESENFVVRGNLLVGIRGTGAFAFAGPRVALLHNNVFYRNQDISRSLIELSVNPAEAGGPGVDLFNLNNIFHDNGDRTVYRVRDAASGAGLTRDYNLYETGTDGGDLDIGDESNSETTDDPLFTDPAVPAFVAADGTQQIQRFLRGFRTEEGSTARGASANVFDIAGSTHPTAIPEMAERLDAFGTPRPAAAPWDVGLFQSCDGTCECAEGTVDCGGCVDTAVDELHCGGCDMPCEGGDRCVAGACTAAPDGGAPDGGIDGGGPRPDSGGPRPDSGPGADGGPDPEDGGGCGCRTTPSTSDGPLGLGLAFLLAVLLRRRRR
ncbi:MAG: MYXO-CTERM sorting domain-containing protein, partial [Deltaproteobacteria bacterium]|nr:MYXO-CTERM sorting domain-containing protein [Deltaproteobacteria bacterium]